MLQVSPVAEDECYFDIPSNWKWVRIGDFFDLVNGKAFKPSDWSDIGIPIVRIQNLNDNTAPYNYCSTPCESKYYIHGGELLFSWSGTPGTSFGAFIWNGGEAVLNQHIFIVYPKIQADTMYLMYALNAELHIFIEKAHGGAGLKHITRKEFDACLLPIPPLAEQKRIVAKIEELLPLIDRYEKAWSRLEEFNKQFPVDLQKSILQMAIQGKLVEQRLEEGTGEELYQQIQAEKKKLIAEGKIKKEKPLPEITEEEKPFDIPESWKWVQLGEIILSVADGPHFSPKYQDTGIPFISTRNIVSGKLDFSSAKYIDKELHEELCKRCKPKKGDVLYSKGGTTGVAAVNDSDIEFNVWVHVAVLSLNSMIYPYFLAMALNSPHCYQLSQLFTHGTGNHDLGLTRMVKITLPLPPLAEQKRIVARLEELLPLCEALKS